MFVWLVIALLAGPVLAAELPVGTEIQVRLKNKVATNNSKRGDPIETIVIVPVMIDGKFLIPVGTKLRGIVEQVEPTTRADQRAVLEIAFSELELGATKTKLGCRVAGVDNARETVDQAGRIIGILASESLSARLDQGINKIAQRHSGLADVLDAAKRTILKAAEGDIVYDPGVELTLKLTLALSLDESNTLEAGPKLQPVSAETELFNLVTSQPVQTLAESPPKPSDLTNLMFIGSREQLEKAFAVAGWAIAAELNARSKLETFRAIAELRGYKEAPMSTLVLDGRKPDLVFQKQNNTFAQRHHLRIWRRPVHFRGQEVWVCAATHDISIDFSPENHTFIHRIDSNIDRERAKVVNDLLLTGLVKSLSLVEREAAPRESSNATGDKLETDGRMAVLILE